MYLENTYQILILQKFIPWIGKYSPNIKYNEPVPNMKISFLVISALPEEHRGKIICSIWVVSSSRNREKYSIKISCLALAEDVIAEVIRKRTLRMNMTPEEQKQCVLEYQSSYVLKVCGCDQFLLGKHPISQYKVGSGVE